MAVRLGSDFLDGSSGRGTRPRCKLQKAVATCVVGVVAGPAAQPAPSQGSKVLVPILPFVAMLAAMKVWDLAEHTAARARVVTGFGGPYRACPVWRRDGEPGIRNQPVSRPTIRRCGAARTDPRTGPRHPWPRGRTALAHGGALVPRSVVPSLRPRPWSLSTPGGLALAANRDVSLVAPAHRDVRISECIRRFGHAGIPRAPRRCSQRLPPVSTDNACGGRLTCSENAGARARPTWAGRFRECQPARRPMSRRAGRT